MEERAVTCGECKLKYFARGPGECPRCHARTPDPVQEPPRAAPFAPAPAAEGGGARMRTLAIIGIVVAIPVVWALKTARTETADTAAAAAPEQCGKIAGLVNDGTNAMKDVEEQSAKRSADINYFITFPDAAKLCDRVAGDLAALAITDTELRAEADDYARLLRHFADLVRDLLVSARSGDRARVDSLRPKFDQDAAEEKQIQGRIRTTCRMR